MTYLHNDGGREAAGYKGHTGDCVTRAIAIATGKPYVEIFVMATNVYFVGDVKYVRSIKQGRKPQGLTRWNGRLTTASLEALKVEAKRLEPYYTVSDLIRIAVDKYVCTELLNS